MARQNFEKYINNIGDKANLKKYLYILRSIACIIWIDKFKEPPPKDYKKVIIVLPKKVQEFFEYIVKEKRVSEKIEGNRNLEIENFVISFFDKKFKKDKDKFNKSKFNKLFKKYGKM